MSGVDDDLQAVLDPLHQRALNHGNLRTQCGLYCWHLRDVADVGNGRGDG